MAVHIGPHLSYSRILYPGINVHIGPMRMHCAWDLSLRHGLLEFHLTELADMLDFYENS